MQIGNGREKTRDYLKEHPELVAELREKVAASHAAAAGKHTPTAKSKEESDPEEDMPPEE
jgi:hypothetical protein